MEQKIKFKWFDFYEKSFVVNSGYVPPVGATVSLPDVVGTVTAIHCIHSPFDGWQEVIVTIDPVR